MRYAFWNNKGGTGKTSLAFQAICRFAERNPNSTILAIDACPQANLSELFLGGLTGKMGSAPPGTARVNASVVSAGYFQLRLPSPYNVSEFDPQDFIAKPL